jgi:hypothetical protein
MRVRRSVPARGRDCAKLELDVLIYALLRFVLVRVISWIVLFGRVKGAIHESTRTNTKPGHEEELSLTQSR